MILVAPYLPSPLERRRHMGGRVTLRPAESAGHRSRTWSRRSAPGRQAGPHARLRMSNALLLQPVSGDVLVLVGLGSIAVGFVVVYVCVYFLAQRVGRRCEAACTKHKFCICLVADDTRLRGCAAPSNVTTTMGLGRAHVALCSAHSCAGWCADTHARDYGR